MTVKQSMSLLYGIVAALLLLCLLHMPYGFYVLVRIIATLAFCFFAYVAKLYRRGWRMMNLEHSGCLCGSIPLVLNPICLQRLCSSVLID